MKGKRFLVGLNVVSCALNLIVYALTLEPMCLLVGGVNGFLAYIIYDM